MTKEAEKIMDKSAAKKNNYNLGLSVGRMIMCFEVILTHFWEFDHGPKLLLPFAVLRSFAVPFFMMTSFFLTEKQFWYLDAKKLKRRFFRLFYVQAAWAVIYFAAFFVGDKAFDLGYNNHLSDLGWQILTGHSSTLNPTMWFQTDLIIVSLLFVCLFLLLKKFRSVSVVILISAVFICLVLQYSGLNTALFSDLRFELQFPLGRLFEVIPFAVIGFLFAHYHVFDKIRKVVAIPVVCCLFLLCLIGREFGILEVGGYGYSGIPILLSGMLFMSFFYMMPLTRLPERIKKLINYATDYTQGIYCMHRLVATFLFLFLRHQRLEIPDFASCILIYLISYGIAFLFSRIPNEKVKMLFV